MIVTQPAYFGSNNSWFLQAKLKRLSLWSLRRHALRANLIIAFRIFIRTFSARVVKYWNKLPSSFVTDPSVNAFKKRLEKAWTKAFPYLPHWLNTHLSIPLRPTHPTYTPPINSYHLYILPNSLFNLVYMWFIQARCWLLFTILTFHSLQVGCFQSETSANFLSWTTCVHINPPL